MSEFLQVLSFPKHKNVSRIKILIGGIANVSMEPPVEVSDKCRPADLTPIEKLNCSQHPGLSGRTFLDLLVFSKSSQVFFDNMCLCRKFS